MSDRELRNLRIMEILELHGVEKAAEPTLAAKVKETMEAAFFCLHAWHCGSLVGWLLVYGW